MRVADRAGTGGHAVGQKSMVDAKAVAPGAEPRKFAARRITAAPQIAEPDLLNPVQEKPPPRRLVRGVAGQHLIGQRQTFWDHHQSNDDLHTIRPVIARVPETVADTLEQA